MSSPHEELNQPEKLKRSQFRKKKKIEKRRAKRQLNAEKNKPIQDPVVNVESVVDKQNYERDKALWEEREQKFKLIELAKKKAREKQEKAKAHSQKRWQDTLLNLPLMPPNFSTINASKNTTFKTFVQPTEEQSIVPKKKTYRDRYLDQKLSKSMR